MNTEWYRQFAKNIVVDRNTATTEDLAETINELLDYIAKLENIIVECPDAETIAHDIHETEAFESAHKNAQARKLMP